MCLSFFLLTYSKHNSRSSYTFAKAFQAEGSKHSKKRTAELFALNKLECRTNNSKDSSNPPRMAANAMVSAATQVLRSERRSFPLRLQHHAPPRAAIIAQLATGRSTIHLDIVALRNFTFLSHVCLLAPLLFFYPATGFDCDKSSSPAGGHLWSCI